MKALELSQAADADLADIENYGSAAFGEEAAASYLRGFASAFALISRHPAIGAVHDEVRPPIRSLPHGSHRIYYDVLEDRIVVQRILHEAMDVKRHL